MSRTKDSFRNRRTGTGLSVRGHMFANEPAASDKIPRNEPCPCGSGKKYKNCCRVRPRSFWQRVKRWFSGRED